MVTPVFRSRVFVAQLASSLAAVVSGCATERVDYEPLVAQRVPAAEWALPVRVHPERSGDALLGAAPPGATQAEAYRRRVEFVRELISPLGSQDYLLIGVISGRGGSSEARLSSALCRRAAREGGDVVLVTDAGLTTDAWSEEFTGYAPLPLGPNVPPDWYREWQFDRSGREVRHCDCGPRHSRPHPPSGTTYFPYSRGFVLKHCPGAGADRRRVLSLSDDEMNSYLRRRAQFADDTRRPFHEVVALERGIVEELGGLR